MGKIVIPNATDWQTVNRNDGLCYVEGRLAELVLPEAWQGAVGAFSHALDQHPWDYSGNGDHGTREGGVADAADGWDFDGVDDYVDVGTGTSLNFDSNQAFVVSAWFKTTDDYGAIVSFRSSTNRLPIIDLMVGHDGAASIAGRVMALVRDDTSGLYAYARVTGGTVSDGLWHHALLVRGTSTSIELFLDGVSQGSDSGTGADGAITTNLRACGLERRWVQQDIKTVDERYLTGLIDDVRIYNRVLPESLRQRLAERPNIAYEARIKPRVFLVPGGGAVAITRATETDSARTLTSLETTQIGRAAETDAARTLTPSHTVLLGRAEDTSSARALTSLETTQIGRAGETNAARTLSALETTQIGRAGETNAARTLTASTGTPILRATETDAARTLGKSGGKTLRRASESDVARTLSGLKTYQLGRAGELEAARALSRLETSVLGRASEVDAARGLATSQERAIGRAAEIDAARTITESGGGASILPLVNHYLMS